MLTWHTPSPDFEGDRPVIERDILGDAGGEVLRGDPEDLGFLRRLGANLP